MVISATTAYSGPSVYSPRPVLRYELRFPPGTLRPAADPAFLARLRRRLPGLDEPHEGCVSFDALVQAVREGKAGSIAHLFEHLCIELHNRAGAELQCIRANGPVGLDVAEAIVPYEDEDVARRAGRLARDIVCSLLPAICQGPAPTFDLRKRFRRYLDSAERHVLPVQDRALVRAARERDIPVARLAGRLVQLGHGPYRQRVSATKTSHTNVVSNDLAANKDYSRRILVAVGLPVPRYERVYNPRSAVAAAERIGYPVVVKPNNGKMGGGVSVGMKDSLQLLDAFERARKIARSILVEELVPGSDFRMLVIDGKLHAASHRVPAHVRGDGVHTIAQLIDQANSDPRRGEGSHSAWTRLEIDEQAERLIRELLYTRDSVPRPDQVVYLRRNANTSAGGTAVDVTDQVHPENRAIAVRAATAIGLDVVGVDLITRDISKPLRETGGRICEVNSRPGLRKHLWPASGKPRDVITPILDMLFPPGAPSRIPLAVVTGSGPVTTTAHVLAHLLSGNGRNVGLATPQGVFVGGFLTGAGDIAGPVGTQMILLDRTVEVAVVAAEPSDVIAHGLGYDVCDVCAVVGDEDGTTGPVDALRLVAGTARGSIVLDPGEAAEQVAGLGPPDRWHVSTNGARPSPGGGAVWLDRNGHDAAITFHDRSGAITRIPLPADSVVASSSRFQRAVLFAIATALSLGHPAEAIAERLGTVPAEFLEPV